VAMMNILFWINSRIIKDNSLLRINRNTLINRHNSRNKMIRITNSLIIMGKYLYLISILIKWIRVIMYKS
jgi:hypothetical protein